MKNIFSIILVTLVISLIQGCSVRGFDENDSSGNFKSAEETYKSGSYEMAITELREFIARFPYSQHTAEAELMVANSYFELAQYEDAVFEYEQFVKLHPVHPEIDFAMYRVGESYWMEAPEDIDREQEFTKRAMAEWEKLIAKSPNGKYTALAKKQIELGMRRLAESEQFIARFYCKQGIYHACAQRYLAIIDKFGRYPEIANDAKKKAAGALVELAEEKKKNPDKIDNLYFRDYSAAQLAGMAQKLVSDQQGDKK